MKLRAYGRWRRSRGLPGGTHQAVRKQIQCGRLAPAYLEALGLIDATLADRLWPAHHGDDAAQSVPVGVNGKPPRAGGGQPAPESRADAERRRALALAEKAEIEVRIRRGEVVELADIKSRSLAIARLVRDQFLALRRFGGELTGLDDPRQAERLLEGEIDRILDHAIARVEELGRGRVRAGGDGRRAALDELVEGVQALGRQPEEPRP
jgi:hypothetical protein